MIPAFNKPPAVIGYVLYISLIVCASLCLHGLGGRAGRQGGGDKKEKKEKGTKVKSIMRGSRNGHIRGTTHYTKNKG